MEGVCDKFQKGLGCLKKLDNIYIIKNIGLKNFKNKYYRLDGGLGFLKPDLSNLTRILYSYLYLYLIVYGLRIYFI